jgi:hypothetical protein
LAGLCGLIVSALGHTQGNLAGGISPDMKIPALLSLVSVLSFAGCKKEEPPSQPVAAPPSPSPILAPVEYLGANATGKKNAEKTIDTVSLNRAVQAFSASEGRLPKDLSELSPLYLPKLPPPPYGMKYDYDPASGEVKVVPK